jgi:ABC-type multidrug transport system fused ATPase/permease subunit
VTQYLREILHLLGEERRKLPWLISLFLGSSLLDFIGIGLVGSYAALVVDSRALSGTLGDVIEALALPREKELALILLGLLLVGIFLLKAVTAIGIFRTIVRFSQRQKARLQSILMQSYQRLPYMEFLRRNSSEYIIGIDNLTDRFANNVVQTGLRTVSDGIVALVILGLLAWQNAAALALLVGMLLANVYGYDRLFRRKLHSHGEKANRAYASIVQGIHEGIEGFKEIRILGKEEYFLRRVHDGAIDFARSFAFAEVIAIAPRFLLEFTMVSFVVCLILLMLLLGRDLTALIPTLGMFGVAALRLVPSANTLSNSLVQLRYSRDSVSRLDRDFSALDQVRPEPGEDMRGLTPEPFRALVLYRISFTYPNASQAALKDVSLEIREGESIGLIGPSGSGKTTLVDVLLGLLDPQHGEVRYNGQPLKAALGKWRAQVAYLPQQVFLIDNTLRRNVALGVDDDEVDEDRVQEALRQARLAELVAQLPEALNTVLGERGVRLSGGQRQRVALARAFYHRRDVLVMDEATSAIDNETEREIVDEIHRLKGRKTLIVIAHRPTTVRDCDRIYRLEGGRIAEQGTYKL